MKNLIDHDLSEVKQSIEIEKAELHTRYILFILLLLFCLGVSMCHQEPKVSTTLNYEPK